MTKRTVKNIITTTSYQLIGWSIIVIGPIYAYLYKNEYVVPTGVVVSCFDPHTLNGYLINVSYQPVFCVIGTCALIGFEGIFIICDSTFYNPKELIKFRSKEFDQRIKTNEMTSLQQKQEFIGTYFEYDARS